MKKSIDYTKVHNDNRSSYIDKDNCEEVKEELKACKNFFEVKAIIEREFPSWIVSMSDAYSKDYDFLNTTWELFCGKIKAKKQQIVLVDFIPNEEDYTKDPRMIKPGQGKAILPVQPMTGQGVSALPSYSLLTKFLDTMAVNGFLVRRNTEFILCEYCKAVLPSKDLYKKWYKQWYYTYGDRIPRYHKRMCEGCKDLKVSYKDLSDTTASINPEDIKVIAKEINCMRSNNLPR